MKRLFTIIALALWAFMPSAHAQVEADAAAGSASQSAAGSISGAQINIGAGGATRGTATPAIGSSLSYETNSTIYNKPVDLSNQVPNMWAPGLGGGGSNPCVVSVSGAGVGSGFGLSFGRSFNDGECQVRETLRTVGGQLNADNPSAQVLQKNIACQSDIIRQAMRETAQELGNSDMRCYNDRPARPRVVARAPAAAAVRVGGGSAYTAAVAGCRKASDREFGGCMKRARELL